jgi:outer membrane protein OmpA-like peptidoglycan-associated protein/tetratricopeptide (TPR) repeat protein
MKTILKYTICGLLLIIISQPTAFSQSARVKRADKMFDGFLYNEAIVRYEGVATTRKNAHVLRRLGESYRLTGNTDKSEKNYQLLFEKYPNEVIPEDHLHYADVQRMNGKYAEATMHMEEYSVLRSNEIRTSGQLKDHYYYNDLLVDKGQFSVRNLKNNTDESDFGASYNGKQIVFASSRHSATMVNYPYDWTDRNFYDLYTSEENPKNKKKLKKVKRLKAVGGLNKRFHEGPASFNADGTMMVFTRNSYEKKKNLNKQRVRQLELWYSVKNSKGKWGKIEPMPFNSKDYSIGHGSLSADGNTLYFTSDMPGGYGATDIYYVTRSNNNSAWSAPINAGNTINTEGKEMFPFYHEKGILFFASDGLPGLGGLDIFIANAKNGKMGNPKNVGSPVNGSSDDFAFVLNKDMKEGYYSSNRSGGQGSDDIYGFDLLKAFKLSKKLEGYTKDEKTDMALAGSKVKLSDQNGNIIAETESDGNGYYTFEVEPNLDLVLTGTHDKYYETSKNITSNTDDDVIKSDLLLEKIPVIGILVTVTDIKTKEPLQGVRVLIKNTETGNVISETYTDKLGQVREPLSPALMNKKINYSLTFEKTAYISKTISYVHIIDKEGDLKISTTMGKIEVGTDIGKLIDINPIYFDYNKSNIRVDAALELDRIVAVMLAFPDIEIELRSHTDCRGGQKSNMNLSDKRAKSSAAYITSKGISKNRISGKGYGESRLVNNCACEGKVKSDCSDESHQENRRTEFIIVKINVPVNTLNK